MGSGKTTAAINYMNENEGRYIYITPFLSEGERVKQACPSLSFKEPDDSDGTKLNSLKKLMEAGENIVSTHSLFTHFDNDVIALLKSNEYILIADEVMEVINVLNVDSDDINMLHEMKFIEKGEHQSVKWITSAPKKSSIYYPIYSIISSNDSLRFINNHFLIETLPVSLFCYFKDIMILTYMFDSSIQRAYYDLNGIEYDYWYVTNDYHFTDDISKNGNFKPDTSLINIVSTDNYNSIGDDMYSFSKEWIKDQENQKNVKRVTNNMIRGCWKLKSGTRHMWSTFKDYAGYVKPERIASDFVSVNARATNEFADIHYCSYLANIFIHPAITQFFSSNGIKLNQNDYALSQLLQWVYRSAIRKGEPIHVYLPSKRMRTLFIEWLDQFGEVDGRRAATDYMVARWSEPFYSSEDKEAFRLMFSERFGVDCKTFNAARKLFNGLHKDQLISYLAKGKTMYKILPVTLS